MEGGAGPGRQLGPHEPSPEDWRDWTGLPADVLAKVAEALVAQTEAAWAARLQGAGRE